MNHSKYAAIQPSQTADEKYVTIDQGGLVARQRKRSHHGRVQLFDMTVYEYLTKGKLTKIAF